MEELNETIDQALLLARKLRAFAAYDAELFQLSESLLQRLLQIQEKVKRVLSKNVLHTAAKSAKFGQL